jgi:Cu/Ag efflux pump CusA
MRNLFAVVVMLFLYLPLFWFSSNVSRGRSFIDLSFGEMLAQAFLTLMPLVILYLLSQSQKKSDE